MCYGLVGFMKIITKGKFRHVVEHCVKKAHFSNRKKTFLLNMIDTFNANGESTLSAEQLCALGDIHLATAYKYRNELVKDGYIKFNRITMNCGCFCQYYIVFNNFLPFGLEKIAQVTNSEFMNEDVIKIPTDNDINLSMVS